MFERTVEGSFSITESYSRNNSKQNLVSKLQMLTLSVMSVYLEVIPLHTFICDKTL